MTGFSADWLRLREPFDHAAREASAPALDLASLAPRLRRHAATDAPLTVMDLACGTGANLRELAPRLGGRQRWLLVDHDPALLSALPARLSEWASAQGHALTPQSGGWHLAGPGFAADITLQRTDLVAGLDTLDFDAVQLVTGSALLDLVSADWFDAFARRACAARVALLFALNVDGRTTWHPQDTDDETVHAAFLRHQRRDKGFGPALGPTAVAHASQVLKAAHYQVRQAPSDWPIDPSRSVSVPLLTAMIEGMAAAASEQDPDASTVIQAWRSRRQACANRSRLVVGHADLLAWPQA